MDPLTEYHRGITRRQLFSQVRNGVGAAALASLLGPTAFAAPKGPSSRAARQTCAANFAIRCRGFANCGRYDQKKIASHVSWTRQPNTTAYSCGWWSLPERRAT